MIDGSVGALDPREGSLQQRVVLYVRYGLRGSLCDSLSCVHLRNEGSCHCHTLLPFTCVHDFLSLSGHRHLLGNVLRTAVRCDCASCSLLCIARGGHSHASELCELVFLLNEVSSSLVAVHSLLNADPSLLTWLCTSLLAGVASVWWSFPALVLSQARLLSARDSATSYLATARLTARSLHHCIRRLSCGLRYVLDLAASHRLDHLCLPLHLWSRCSFLRHLDLSLKLFDITSTRSFQGVRISRGTLSLIELGKPKSTCIRTEITLSSCK